MVKNTGADTAFFRPVILSELKFSIQRVEACPRLPPACRQGRDGQVPAGRDLKTEILRPFGAQNDRCFLRSIWDVHQGD